MKSFLTYVLFKVGLLERSPGFNPLYFTLSAVFFVHCSVPLEELSMHELHCLLF